MLDGESWFRPTFAVWDYLVLRTHSVCVQRNTHRKQHTTMKKKNNITQLTAKQFSGMSRQAVALGKSIVAQEGKVLTEWLALGRLVLVSGFRQADVIRMLAKNGVKLDKSDLNKAVTCAKWKTKKKKFTSLNAMYEKAPRKQKSGKRAKKKKTQVVVTTRKAKSLAERFVPANKRDAFVRALGLTA